MSHISGGSTPLPRHSSHERELEIASKHGASSGSDVTSTPNKESPRAADLVTRTVSSKALSPPSASPSSVDTRAVDLKSAYTHTSKGMKILKAIGNFFVAIWHSITLALTQKDQQWRKYEKYHFLSEQTLSGLDKVIGSTESASIYTKQTLDTIHNWAIEAKGSTPLSMPSKKAKDADMATGKYHLQKAIRSLLQAAQAQDRKTDCRTLYKSFLSHLREAMESKAYQKADTDPSLTDDERSLKALANELCYTMYTQSNMSGFTQSLVSHVSGKEGPLGSAFDSTEAETPSSDGLTPPGTEAPVMSPIVSPDAIDIEDPDTFEETPRAATPLEEHLTQIGGMYSEIQEASASKKINPATKIGQSIRGEVRNLGFDPHMQGNPPYRKFDAHMRAPEGTTGRTVGNLRISTPTKGAEINPEFKAYLRALKARGQKHMYINLQRSHEGNAGEVERSSALHALAQDPEFAGTLSVVTLDKNSSFYNQKDGFAKLSAGEFKSEFCRRLADPTAGFYIPDRIGTTTREQIQQEASKILDGLHAHFFENRDNLSVEERHDMIELAYTILISRFVEMSGADFYNNSCKDCIDRGGGANALMAYIMTFFKGDKTTKADLSMLPAMTFSDAIWARKREIIHERLDRALGAAEVFLGASPEAKEWMRSQMAFTDISHLEVDPQQSIAS